MFWSRREEETFKPKEHKLKRKIEVEMREPQIDTTRKLFENKRILITGGAGSIGSRTIRELLKYNPKTIRVFDNDETRLFYLQNEFEKHKNLRFFSGDIRDKERLSYAIENIDIVFHMAALKHVTICEYNPFEAVKTNVIGIQNLIDVAMAEEVDKVIFTSSDKAVNPTNTMGVTKLLCEKLIVSANYYKGPRKTVFSSIRFGNVLGTSGSVIPLFKEQIKNGGPITITDPNMTRFVMSFNEAINLIFQCVEMAIGGEVFILKMPALNINDLADVVINELASKHDFKPNEIKKEIIGLKAGEKLYEELMTEEEVDRAFETENMFIVLPQIKGTLQDYQEIDYSIYKNLKKPKLKSYNSKNTKLLSKHEIKNLLFR